MSPWVVMDSFSFKMFVSLVWKSKIERMKGELHLLDAEGKQRNKHTFFVDSKNEVETFDLANHLNVPPELLDRVYNRPTLQTLETKSIKGAVEPGSIKKLARERKHQYRILSQRIDREKKMFIISQKIQTRKDLQLKAKNKKLVESRATCWCENQWDPPSQK
uniref:Probable U3 small nucleolar RNA-associated protein 11 n=1 Tax=Oryzias sinensis TaxID=183150 RepID=A0A8C8DM28_9TELE